MTASSTLIQPTQVKYRINLAASYRLLETKIEAHNLKHHGNAALQIKAAQRGLAEKLVRLYKQAFNRWQLACLGAIEGLVMPMMELNNKFLARIMSCTDRTIKNYRKRLRLLGFIAKEQWHGSKCPYELEISTDFLVFEERSSSGIWNRKLQNFPLTSTSTLTGTLTGTMLEENSSNYKASQLEPDKNEGPELHKASQPEPTKSEGPERQQEPINRNEEGGQYSEVAARYAAQLWVEARRRLWPKQYFSSNEEKAAQEALKALFELVPISAFGRAYEIWIFRVYLAQLYWQREFSQAPPPPLEFFAKDNPNGFAITKGWMDDASKYPAKPTNYKSKRRMQSRDSRRAGDTTRLGNLFK